MNHLKLFLLALFISASASAQWSQMGNTLQRSPDGTGFKYRFNLGAPGYFAISDTLKKYAPISPSGSYIQASPSAAQDASIKLKQTDDRYLGISGNNISTYTNDGSYSGSRIYFGNNDLRLSSVSDIQIEGTSNIKRASDNKKVLWEGDAAAPGNYITEMNGSGTNTTLQSPTIVNGSINNTPIGLSFPNQGRFTTLNANASTTLELLSNKNTGTLSTSNLTYPTDKVVSDAISLQTLQVVTDRNSNLSTNIMFAAGKGLVALDGDAIITPNDGVIGAKIYAGSTGQVTFGNGNTQVGTFLGNGNFGIGTSNPSQKLEVNGNIISGNEIAARNLASDSRLNIYAIDDTPAIQGANAANSNTKSLSINRFGGNVMMGTAVDDGINILQVEGSVKASSLSAEFDGKSARLNTGGFVFVDQVAGTAFTITVPYTGGASFQPKTGVVALTEDIGYKMLKTANGNGISTTISIPHGLPASAAGKYVTATANNAASAGIQYVTIDAANVNIFYTVAPASGTNNLLYSIDVKP